MRLPTLMPVAFLCITALAGCASSGEGDDGEGTFALAVADSLAGGELRLKGVYLHGAGNASDWVDVLGPATDARGSPSTVMEFEGSGANVSINGSVPAGRYDGVRV